MRLKCCFALAAALLVLLSLSCVAASENATDGLSLEDDGSDVLDAVDADENMLSANGEVDLSVKMDVESSYVDGSYNSVGSEVPWTITVTAKGGTARNTQVREVLSPNMGYVSHNATMGTYDSSRGIWNVGDLASSGKASLTIVTKLNRAGTYLVKSYATSDSTDKNMLDNFAFLSIQTGSPKSTSNITETSDDRAGPSHNLHYASMINDRIKDDRDTSPDTHPHVKKPDKEKKKKDKEEEEKAPDNGGYGGYYQVKSQSVSKSVIDSQDSNSSSDSKEGSSGGHADAILAYDYTKIPIIILALFFIILFGIVVRDRLKDKL
jgi:hypothetical protein